MAVGMEDPALVVMGGELTGIHSLTGLPAPGPSGYHIGGVGYALDEAAIKTIAESVERYAQLCPGPWRFFPYQFNSKKALEAEGADVFGPDDLRYFSPAQSDKRQFPFRKWDEDTGLGWIRLDSVLGGKPCWIPAQTVLVGYPLDAARQEPRVLPSVTTGTATHTSHLLAANNAILELALLDAAMGHWYTDRRASLIDLDETARNMLRIEKVVSHADQPRYHFHVLDSLDLPGRFVACVIRSRPGLKPRFAVGLGAGADIDTALGKAFLEAAGVLQLAKYQLLLEAAMQAGQGSPDRKGQENLFNLDDNVASFAHGRAAGIIEEKFTARETVPVEALREPTRAPLVFEAMREAMKSKGHRLYGAALDSRESMSLGLNTVRLWSPDLLPLCLPGAPPLAHKRLQQYGSPKENGIHPYP
jgi:thiazole/oxazole-forming peptide maturase SagD family component